MGRQISTIRRTGLVGCLFRLSLHLATRRGDPAAGRRFSRVFRLWYRLLVASRLVRIVEPNRSAFKRFIAQVGSRRDQWDRQLTLLYLGSVFKRDGPFKRELRQFFKAAWRDVTDIEGTPLEAPGILVASHQNTIQLVMWQVLDQERTFVIGRDMKGVDVDEPRTAEGKSAAMTQHLLQGRQMLKAGGRVGILGDGQKGGSGRPRTICGVERPFQPGFAMLAIQNGVAVQFVSSEWLDSGRLRVTFGEPFRAPGDLSPAAQVDAYLDWYCERLSQAYRDSPHTLNDNQIQRFLRRASRGGANQVGMR